MNQAKVNEIKTFACEYLSKQHSTSVNPNEVVIVAIKTSNSTQTQAIIQVLYSPEGKGFAKVNLREWKPRILMELEKLYGDWFNKGDGYGGKIVDIKLSSFEDGTLLKYADDEDFIVKDQSLLMINHICRQSQTNKIWKLIAFNNIKEKCEWCKQLLSLDNEECKECKNKVWCSEQCRIMGEYSHQYVCKANFKKKEPEIKIKRNDKCPCKSGKKYKVCCLK